MTEDDDAEQVTGLFDLTYGLPLDELDELDQGCYLCVDCGTFYAPDGEDGHYGCPTPRDASDYPPGLLN